MTHSSTVEARVQALMDKFEKLKHAEIQLYSGGLIWGDAYEAKKAPIRAMQIELESAIRAEVSGKDAERLDWVLTGGTLIQSANTQKWRYFGDPSLTYYDTKREAIDAAIQSTKEKS